VDKSLRICLVVKNGPVFGARQARKYTHIP
jgi:hypothetical protein